MIRSLAYEDLADQQIKFSHSQLDSELSPVIQPINSYMESKIHKKKIEIDNQTEHGKMLQEIEEFIDKSMREMHLEVKTIEANYQEEILQLMGLDSTYDKILTALKEEMKEEVDNMKAQYEVQRMNGIEEIRAKYGDARNKRNSKKISISKISI